MIRDGMIHEGKESSQKNYEGIASSLLGILFYWNCSFLTVLSTFSLSQKGKNNKKILCGETKKFRSICKGEKTKKMKEEKICWTENTEEKILLTWVYKGKIN